MRRSLAERASFRDPAGRVFEKDGVLLRRVAPAFAPAYQSARDAGLLTSLQHDGLLIPHEEQHGAGPEELLLRPERIPFISYPYEWVPAQLRDAALLTLDLADRALRTGHLLRDASAFNVQFRDGRPIFIDTLSFAPRVPGQPWLAYGQFCRHFLAPLVLATLVDSEQARLTASFPDGIPLPVAQRTLGRRGWLRLGVLVHLHLQAWADGRAQGAALGSTHSISDRQLAQTIDGLRSTIEGLPFTTRKTTWLNYEGGSHYSDEDRTTKAAFVAAAVERIGPASLWDLGANTGDLARQHAPAGGYALALDADLGSSEVSYASSKAAGKPVTTLWMNLLAPSSASGWANEERASLLERGPADLIMALALIHHLAISGRIPFDRIVQWLSQAGKHAVVELPGPEDPMVRQIAQQQRYDLVTYSQAAFEQCLAPTFEIIEKRGLKGIDRTLYLLRRKPA